MQTLGLKHYPAVSESVVRRVLNEIALNHREQWWLPKSDKHDIFERAWMKFVSGNLNYFDFNNMLNLAEEDPRNPAFKDTYKVCEELKAVLENMNGPYGPFGRMNLWKVPGYAFIKPHKDDFPYHRCITRFIVSLNHAPNEVEVFIDSTKVEMGRCSMFQFLPATQEHAFKNLTEPDWYFLAFDLWDLEKFNTHVVKKAPPKAKKFLD